MGRAGRLGIKVGVVIALAVLTAIAARAAYTAQWVEVEGTVTRTLGHGVVAVEFELDGEPRSTTVRGQPHVDDPAVVLPDPGDEVVLQVDRASGDDAVLGAAGLAGFDGFIAALGFLLTIAVATIMLRPEYVLVREPSDVLESHGFYWRS